jgi:hypothetical protein
MCRIFFLCLLCLVYGVAPGQTHEKIKVAILGTFHFGETSDYKGGNFEGLLTPQRQKEIDELNDQLLKFYPDKIFVENTPESQRYWDKVYSDWIKGSKPQSTASENNEVFQIGIKLAKKLNNRFGVICVNYVHPESDGNLRKAKTKADTLYYFYSQALHARKPAYDAFFDNNPIAKKSFDEVLANHGNWKNLSISEHLVKLNQPESLKALHYINVMAWIDQSANGIGAELTSKEYFGNIKILQNILGKVGPFDKKVLVLIGAAHVKALQDMLSSHPFFEVVPAGSFLR